MPRCPGSLVVLVLTLVLAASAAAAPAATLPALDEHDLLDFCVDHPENCAISALAVDDGQQGHLNPDRPQVLASTSKILMLLAYGQAVVDGAIDPDATISRDEWARLLTLDGFALRSSWEELGMPTEVSWNDLLRAMIRHSDNATPDHLIDRLGAKRIKKARQLFRGFHDIPAPISAMFGLWSNGNGVGGTGNRIAMEYGSFGSKGYQRELASFFATLDSNAAVTKMRESLCVSPPWQAGGACNPPNPATAEAMSRQLHHAYFTRSTTRTYADLMSRLLQGTLLKPDVEAVVRPILEIWLEIFPTLSPAFDRYGLKGGSLATSAGPTILTWAHYMRTGAGKRYVVAVFLQDLSTVSGAPTASDVNAFAQKFALDAAFRAQVLTALAPDDDRPEVVPQIRNLKGGAQVALKGRVDNAGPQRTDAFVVDLYVSDDNRLDAGDTLIDSYAAGPIAGFKGKNFTLKGAVPGGASGRYALLVVDGDGDLDEQDEDNNLLWEIVR